VTCFVAAGFEHSIANMFFIPAAIAVRAVAPASFGPLSAPRPPPTRLWTWAASFRISFPLRLETSWAGRCSWPRCTGLLTFDTSRGRVIDTHPCRRISS
jgi:hypothetical protein